MSAASGEAGVQVSVGDLLRKGELTVRGRIREASNGVLYCTIRYEGVEAACVYKPVAGERPLWDFPDGTLAQREVAAYEVSEATGWGLVPPTVLREGPYGEGMIQLWIDEQPLGDAEEGEAEDGDEARGDAAGGAGSGSGDDVAGDEAARPDPSGRQPADAPGPRPADAPARQPADASGPRPADASGSRPVDGSGDPAARFDPAADPVTDPAADPVTDPATDPSASAAGEDLLTLLTPQLALVAGEETVDGWKAIGLAEVGEGRTALLVHADDERLRRLAVLDAVINNGDRKGGHLLTSPDGRLYAIDHGVTFNADDKLRTLLWGWAGEPLPEEALTVLDRLAEELAEGAALATRLAVLITPAETEALRARVRELRHTKRHPEPSGQWPAIPWPPV